MQKILDALVAAKQAGQAPTHGDLDVFQDLLETSGLGGGLGYLNALVGHRFSALMRRRRDTIHCELAFDSESGNYWNFGSVALRNSYCKFTLERGAFVFADARQENCLNGHMFQQTVLSYAGMTVEQADGEEFGTICHFDYPSCPTSGAQAAFFKQASIIIGSYVTIWPSPGFLMR